MSDSNASDEKRPSLFVSMLVAVIVIGAYLYLGRLLPVLYRTEIRLVILFLLWVYIFRSSYKFSLFDLKQAFGVKQAYQIPFKQMLATILSSSVIAWSFVMFLDITVDLTIARLTAERPDLLITIVLVGGVTLFLIIFPFFDFYVLSLPGIEGSLPFQLVLEDLAESVRKVLRSPFLTALVLYSLFYAFPVVLIHFILQMPWLSSIFVWAFIFPILNLGYIAGIGIGEDLLNVRYLELKKWGDTKNFMFLSLTRKGKHGENYRLPRIRIGKLSIVLFSMIAIITAVINITQDVFVVIGLIGTGTMSVVSLYSTLANKGRGAAKEFSALWEEGGFKIETYRVLIPSFFLGALMLNYVIDLMTNYPLDMLFFILYFDLAPAFRFLQFALIIQELMFLLAIFTVVWKVPTAIEKRFIYGMRDVLTTIDQFISVYKPSISTNAKLELIRSFVAWSHENTNQAKDFHRFFEVVLKDPDPKVRFLAYKELNELLLTVDTIDTYKLSTILSTLEPETELGSRLSLYRIWTAIGLQEKELVADAIDALIIGLYDKDIASRWEAGNGLRKLSRTFPEYAAYAQGLVIKALLEGESETQNTCVELLGRFAEISLKLGQMSLNVLVNYLRNVESIDLNVVVSALGELIKKRLALSTDLNEELADILQSREPNQVLIGIGLLEALLSANFSVKAEFIVAVFEFLEHENKEIRVATANLLPIAAQNPTITNDMFIALVDKGLHASDEEVRELTVKGIIQGLEHGRDIPNQVYENVKVFLSSEKERFIAVVLELFARLLEYYPSLVEETLELVKPYFNNESVIVRKAALEVLNTVIEADPETALLGVSIFKNAFQDRNPVVRIVAVHGLGVVGAYHPRVVDVVYESFKAAVDDADWRVRFSTFEAIKKIFIVKEQAFDLLSELVIYGLTDDDNNVRDEARNTFQVLMQVEIRKHQEYFDTIQYLISRTKDPSIKATLLSVLGDITEVRPIHTEESLDIIGRYLVYESVELRLAVLDVLERSLKRYEEKRVPYTIMQKIDRVITYAMKAINAKDPSIRRTGYEAIVQCIKYLGEGKTFQRGRNALFHARDKLEKDPSLLQYLNEAIVRTTPLKHQEY